MIKKADIILFIALIIIGLSISFLTISSNQSGGKVKISIDGHVYGVYSLSSSQTITINKGSQHNIIKIHSGKVVMFESSCHNQICVKHRPISTTNESIVCLPNKIMIEITKNNKEEKFDAISN